MEVDGLLFSSIWNESKQSVLTYYMFTWVDCRAILFAFEMYF